VQHAQEGDRAAMACSGGRQELKGARCKAAVTWELEEGNRVTTVF
jgi:hypothetical protein